MRRAGWGPHLRPSGPLTGGLSHQGGRRPQKRGRRGRRGGLACTAVPAGHGRCRTAPRPLSRLHDPAQVPTVLPCFLSRFPVVRVLTEHPDDIGFFRPHKPGPLSPPLDGGCRADPSRLPSRHMSHFSTAASPERTSLTSPEGQLPRALTSFPFFTPLNLKRCHSFAYSTP